MFDIPKHFKELIFDITVIGPQSLIGLKTNQTHLKFTDYSSFATNTARIKHDIVLWSI